MFSDIWLPLVFPPPEAICCPPPLQSFVLTGLISCRPCSVSHSCMSAVVCHVQETLFTSGLPTSGFDSLPPVLPQWSGGWGDISVPFVAEHSTGTHSLYFVQLGVSHYPPQGYCYQGSCGQKRGLESSCGCDSPNAWLARWRAPCKELHLSCCFPDL